MSFIKLTDKETNKPVYVNANNVEYVIEDANGNCRLQMVSGVSVLPVEPYLDIMGQLASCSV